MNNEEARAWKDMFERLRKTTDQAYALEIFCGFLLAKHAAGNPDPKKYVLDMSAEFLGFIETIADVSSPSLTECVERVLRYSEKMIAGPSSGPRQAV